MDINQIHTQEIDQMKKFFENRTNNHVDLVKKYVDKIANMNHDLAGVVDQASNHDDSKYEEPEYTPYLYITWSYKCKDENKNFDMPDYIDDNAATIHHIKNNRHHPEFHDKKSGSESINRENRDEIPEKPVDATKMTDIDIAEMVADWCAMSEEKGTFPKDWADKNVNIRWNFTDDQTKLIYKLIDDIFDTKSSA